MMRSRAWSKKGDPTIVQVHSRRGANVTIVGCISLFGTINFSKVEPLRRSDMEELKEHQLRRERLMFWKLPSQNLLKKAQPRSILLNSSKLLWMFLVSITKRECLSLWTTVEFIIVRLSWMLLTNETISLFLCLHILHF